MAKHVLGLSTALTHHIQFENSKRFGPVNCNDSRGNSSVLVGNDMVNRHVADVTLQGGQHAKV